jgi:DNA-binding NtrC family response regulator
MTPVKFLVVGSVSINRSKICDSLDKKGFSLREAKNSASALKLFDTYHPSITLLDIDSQNSFDLDLLRQIKKRQSDAIVVVMLDGLLSEDLRLAFRSGAFDVISKPVNPDELNDVISRGLQSLNLLKHNRKIHQDTIQTFSFEQIIGESKRLQETIVLAKKVAESDVSCVLLHGESGTGKELFAKAIHYSSPRALKPFVAINCSAIPANLLESELFGFEKGAFTDAKTRKEGLLEQAEGGSLFLDEIGELDLGLQAKLLRVLENESFRRVGGLHDLPLHVRVIAASNRNLKTESKEHRFRQDLYYRLSRISIELPPLRMRGDDVILLAQNFIEKLDNNWHQPQKRKLTPEVADAFRRYRWEGNVRELRNVVEQALIFEEKDLITMEYIPEEIAMKNQSGSAQISDDLLKASLYFSLPPDGISLDVVEKWLIEEALQRSGGNVTRASEMLKVSRDRIRYHLKKNLKRHPNKPQKPFMGIAK